MLPNGRGQTLLPDFFSMEHVEVWAMTEQAVLFERQADLASID